MQKLKEDITYLVDTKEDAEKLIEEAKEDKSALVSSTIRYRKSKDDFRIKISKEWQEFEE